MTLDNKVKIGTEICRVPRKACFGEVRPTLNPQIHTNHVVQKNARLA